MDILLLGIVVIVTIFIAISSFYTLWLGYEQWQYMNDPHKMLFLSSSNRKIEGKLIKIISKYIPKTEKYNLVELGCGKAVILKYLAQNYKWKSVIGIEGQKSVWLQAWINYYLSPKLINILKSSLEQKWELRLVPSVASPRQERLAAKQTGVCLGELNKIQLLNQNIFDYTVQKPTFHYCYLGVKLMKELYEKGLFADSIVISLDYAIEGVEPTEIIQLETKDKIQNRLLVYKV